MSVFVWTVQDVIAGVVVCALVLLFGWVKLMEWWDR